MFDEMILKAASLMREQAADYRQLDTATTQLSVALVRGVPESIEQITRTCESKLLKMRSRLMQIINLLGTFSDARSKEQDPKPLKAETKKEFETASGELMNVSRQFAKTSNRAASLAIGGTTFAGVCIQMCGVLPTTYSMPYSRRAEAIR